MSIWTQLHRIEYADRRRPHGGGARGARRSSMRRGRWASRSPRSATTAACRPTAACRVCLVEIETPRGGAVGGLVQPSDRDRASSVHTETESVKQSRQTVLELLLAQAPDSPRAGRVCREARRVESTPFEPAADGEVRSLRTLHAGVQRNDGPRGDQPLRPRRTRARSAPPLTNRPTSARPAGPAQFVCPTGAVDLATITARRLQAAPDAVRQVSRPPGPTSTWPIPRRRRACR